MITAKELCERMHKEESHTTSWIDFNQKVMIEFAKLHVAKALKQATKEAINDLQIQAQWLNKSSIINAYPLTNIK